MDFEFIADRPVLDFVATVAERGTSNVEHLRASADLADWIDQSGLVGSRPKPVWNRKISAHQNRSKSGALAAIN